MKKVREKVKSANFPYFIRYVTVFTLIFGAMTLLILQIMRSGIYGSVDATLRNYSQNSEATVLAALRSLNDYTENVAGIEKDLKNIEAPLSANSEVLLFNENGEVLSTNSHLVDTSNLTLDAKKKFHQIRQVEMKTTFGKKEKFREICFPLELAQPIEGIAYAAVLINTSQIESTNQSNEKTVMMVLFIFWLISILASYYLAKLTMAPLLDSMQRQKTFIENASHELRTPLAVLQNRLEGLFRKPQATILDESESVAASLEEVRNMRKLTTNLLSMARRDDGIDPVFETIDTKFFEDILENFDLVSEENGKDFQSINEFQGQIQSDKVLLKQVLTILFDNAMKYTEEEGRVGIRLFPQDRNGDLRIQVWDDGIGIPDTEKARIFDRFYRVDKARTRQSSGFGLGLSLAKQITDALNADIQVRDNNPKGSIFELTLSKEGKKRYGGRRKAKKESKNKENNKTG
ncbi:HAMP domain-containing histidine kinase [Streptococcus sp. 121]|uniref:sensor histidine kinase n=1 Tax=Streptococcus sp. 121 TaxID=2797637 RepID=UPI0018F0FC12|nr:HAMP domain-containing sensor histidine kinase [Streptococcus sp. 121]MBJ6745140.1 HAMP domain-containing histidine kinase [Streptococcus sp. 121]